MHLLNSAFASEEILPTERTLYHRLHTNLFNVLSPPDDRFHTVHSSSFGRVMITRPFLSHVQKHVPAAFYPIALLAACTCSSLATPFRHSLFATAIAWLIVSLYFGARLGFRVGAGAGGAHKRRLNWLAGLLYALSQVCDRAAADVEGTWWTKVGWS